MACTKHPLFLGQGTGFWLISGCISIFSVIIFSSLGFHPNNQWERRREGRGGWSLLFRPSLSLYSPVPESICHSTTESWQLPLPLVVLPPHHVIAADDTEATVQPKKGLVCTCWKGKLDSVRTELYLSIHTYLPSGLKTQNLLPLVQCCSLVNKVKT